MSYNLYNDEDESSAKPPPTPIMEIDINKIREGESYSCTECSSSIEIFYIDESSYMISFKCQNNNESHSTKILPINEFLFLTTKNTYIYAKCSSCNKQQNRINNDEVFKYCVNCKLIFCNNCIYIHNKENNNDHHIINNNETNIKCLLHPNNYNCGYCLDCHCHICYECLETREHIIHRKNNLREIKPTEDEINALLYMIKRYKNYKINLEKEKIKKLSDLDINYNKEKEKINLEYEKEKKKAEIKLKNDLENNEKKYYDEINIVKQRYENEIKLKKDLHQIYDKNIKEKYKNLCLENDNNYKNKLNELLSKYNNDTKMNTNEFNKKINIYENLAKVNEMVYKTYDKYKENYFNNVNIINILMFYHKNNLLKDFKNEKNENF